MFLKVLNLSYMPVCERARKACVGKPLALESNKHNHLVISLVVMNPADSIVFQ